MKKKKSIFFIAFIISLFYVVAVLSGGCAQIGMPVGGPKDSIPPVLKVATPANHSLNFSGKNITLTFDEYIQLDNPLKNVIVSPLPKKVPFIDFKLKTVTVKLYDTLKPNTTYAIQFGNTIRDLNESNPYPNFEYVFSTGKYIDSLEVGGQVTLADKGTVDSTLTVMLYKDAGDSTVYKHKPDYISRLDKDGKFHFNHLAPGTYEIYAIKDESGQYIYNNPTQIFAFADSAVHPNQAGDQNIHLYAYQEQVPPPKAVSSKPEEELKYSVAIKNAPQDILVPLEISFNNPLKKLDSSGIFLADTLNHILPGQSLTLDSTAKKVTIHYNWQGSADYDLIIQKDAVSDSLDKSLAKSDTLRFKTKNESDYGSLKLNFKNLEKFQNPVLQLLNEKGDISSFPLTSSVFQKKLIPPGTYNIQILEDKNKNGKWDPGKFSERLQPEIVVRITQSVSIRANWDNERDIIL